MDDKEKRLSEILNTPRTPEQAQACYEKIQQRLSQEKARKKLVLKRVLACAASLILVCAAVLVPLLLKKDEVRYYDTELDVAVSSYQQFKAEFDNLQIKIPRLDDKAELEYSLYTVNNSDDVVGGKIFFECLTDINYYKGSVTLYQNNVDVDSAYYDVLLSQYTSDGIDYKYNLISYKEDIYSYRAYSKTNNFTIIIEYQAVFDEFTSFIDQLY